MAARRSHPAHIGCSGFSYDHWKGVFYPEKLARSRWLAYYASRFHTVELNVTFYRLPRESTFQGWYERTPPGFLISVKGSRFITHIKKLKDPAEPLKRFFENISPLKEKRAVVLWQLPPSFKADAERLRIFLKEIRHFTGRNAFEFRNETWVRDGDVQKMLSDAGHALCMADWPPFLAELPQGKKADFVYLRRHGHGTYGASYSPEELQKDAARIRHYQKSGKEVFIYFNNDIGGYAPENALYLEGLLSKGKPLKGRGLGEGDFLT